MAFQYSGSAFLSNNSNVVLVSNSNTSGSFINPTSVNNNILIRQFVFANSNASPNIGTSNWGVVWGDLSNSSTQLALRVLGSNMSLSYGGTGLASCNVSLPYNQSNFLAIRSRMDVNRVWLNNSLVMSVPTNSNYSWNTPTTGYLYYGCNASGNSNQLAICTPNVSSIFTISNNLEVLNSANFGNINASNITANSISVSSIPVFTTSNMTATGAIFFDSNQIPSISASADTLTLNVGSTASDQLRVTKQGGVEMMSLRAGSTHQIYLNGNVGIGSTAPTTTLDVSGQARVNNLFIGQSNPRGEGNALFINNPNAWNSNTLTLHAGFGGYIDKVGMSWNAFNSGNNMYGRYNSNYLGWSLLNDSATTLNLQCYGAGYTGSNIPQGVSLYPLTINSNSINSPTLFENGTSLTTKYALSNTLSNYQLKTGASNGSTQVGNDGNGFSGFLLSGITSGLVSTALSIGLNGLSINGTSLMDLSTGALSTIQNAATNTLIDFVNKQIKGYTKWTTQGNFDVINTINSGLVNEKTSLLSDYAKFGRSSIYIDGDSNRIAITQSSNATFSNFYVGLDNMFHLSNVGVGLSNPQHRLHVLGGDMAVYNGGNSGGQGGALNFGIANFPLNGAMATIQGRLVNNNSNFNTMCGDLSFQTRPLNSSSNTSLVEVMRIMNTGNVGIGTNSAQYRLDLSGGGRVYTSNSGGQLLIQSTLGGIGTLSTIDMVTYGSSAVFNNPASVRLGALDDGGFGGHFIIYTKPTGNLSNNSVERVRVTNAGNVGIGSTNPQSALDVNGSVNVNSNIVCQSSISARQLSCGYLSVPDYSVFASAYSNDIFSY